jgi:hypothetical protein
MLKIASQFLLATSALFSFSASGEFIAVCQDLPTSGNPEVHKEQYVGENKTFLITSKNKPPNSICASQRLPAQRNSIRWSSLVNLPENSPDPSSLSLQGSFDKDEVIVNEIIWLGSTTPPVHYLPLREDMVADFSSTAFGFENRAKIQESALSCKPGSRAAGILMHTDSIWPSGIAQSLTLVASGNGKFGLAVSDNQRQSAQTPLELGSMNLSGESKQQLFEFVLPEHSQWQLITVLCPTGLADIQINSIFIKPLSTQESKPRSAWFWRPNTWLEQPDLIWQAAEYDDIS